MNFDSAKKITACNPLVEEMTAKVQELKALVNRVREIHPDMSAYVLTAIYMPIDGDGLYQLSQGTLACTDSENFHRALLHTLENEVSPFFD